MNNNISRQTLKFSMNTAYPNHDSPNNSDKTKNEAELIKIKKYPHDGFFVYRNNGYKKVLFKDILFFKANGAYTYIVLSDFEITTSFNIKRILEFLNDDRFLRIHRSYIVNLEKINEIRNDGDIVLEGGKRISYGTKAKKGLFERLNVLRYSND